MMKSKYFTFVLVFVLVLATLVSVTGAGAAPKSDLSVSISADKTSFSASDAVMVSVTISNNGKNSAKVLKWFTPVDEVEEPLFNVKRDGAAVDYVGAHYKRPAPTGSDYVTLKAGESLTRSVDLGLYYDLSGSGIYELEYNADGTGLSSNKIQFAVAGRAGAPIADAAAPLAVSGSSSFNKCTTAQQSAIVTARSNASTYAASALSYLNSHNSGTTRYTTWFGIFDSGRYNTVTSHYSALSNAMNTASMTFDCGCKKKYYAYVYPNRPYTIYLCSVFWTAPATGTDSKAGTLIHETSHFNVVASTDDWAYGQTNAKSLAISDPVKAIDNADSHEYFAENTPALP
ncbi:MAG: M35 family metallo-endopeptidase [Chloroflexota bacterium]